MIRCPSRLTRDVTNGNEAPVTSWTLGSVAGFHSRSTNRKFWNVNSVPTGERRSCCGPFSRTAEKEEFSSAKVGSETMSQNRAHAGEPLAAVAKIVLTKLRRLR